MVSSRIEKLIHSLASSSPSSHRVGCVLLRKGRIVCSATNLEGKTHPYQSRLATQAGEPYRVSLHAEIRALIRAGDRPADTLVVGRVNRSGDLCLSKPCAVCQLAISESGLRNVYYSTDEGYFERLELSA
jgi:tRNA(Arg) A34 adenosine deaminase TadA